jgi:hypothetical protein
MRSDLKAEFQRLLLNCDEKRSILLRDSGRLMGIRKKFNFTASALALLSSGSLVTILAGFGGQTALKLTAAILSFISGVVSLCIGLTGSDRDLVEMLKGAADYLALREEANTFSIDDSTPEAKLRDILKKKVREYSTLDSKYNRFWNAFSNYPSAHLRGSKPIADILREKEEGRAE